MRNFVQLKDGIVFASHSSSTEVDIPGDNIIEVEQDGIAYLNKKYENGTFIDAPIIKYAILDESNNNTVVGIERTIFSSDVKGPIITNDNVNVLWTWNGTDFIAPATVQPLPTITVNSIEVTTSEIAPAVTAEQLFQQSEQIQIVNELENIIVEEPVIEEPVTE